MTNHFIINAKSKEIKVYLISDEYLRNCAERSKNQLSKNEKSILKSHLRKSKFLSIILDLTYCIVCAEKITHFQTMKTDGEWIWNSDLEHYMSEHNFEWFDEFIIYVLDRQNQRMRVRKEEKRLYDILEYVDTDVFKIQFATTNEPQPKESIIDSYTVFELNDELKLVERITVNA